ncbi:MAG: hypothetical protein U1A78_27265 [Polyangia bacterium]
MRMLQVMRTAAPLLWAIAVAAPGVHAAEPTAVPAQSAPAQAAPAAAAKAAAPTPAAPTPAETTPAPGADEPLPVADAQPEVSVHGSPAEALRAVLERARKDAADQPPRIVAFGEYHQTTGKTQIKSALKRFTEQLLPILQPETSDLVIETFLTEGNCGKKEEAVVKDVEKTTKRPQTTESELVTLIKQAKAGGVQPHILQVSCKQYESVLGSDGSVDYEKMLRLLADLLRERFTTLRERRVKAGVDKIVAVYGGALHNDLYPSQKELLPFTFGPAAARGFPGRYLEVDLYVPEFIAGDQNVSKEPWFPRYSKQARAGKTILVRRGPASFVILFPQSNKKNNK